MVSRKENVARSIPTRRKAIQTLPGGGPLTLVCALDKITSPWFCTPIKIALAEDEGVP
jgi:hypothetical protein